MSFQNVLWGFPNTICNLIYPLEVEHPHIANLFPQRAAHKSSHLHNGDKIGLDEINLDFEHQIQYLLGDNCSTSLSPYQNLFS